MKIELLQRMQVPVLHYYAMLSEIPDQCPQKKYITKYLSNFLENINEGIGLLFHGSYSTGKSAAASILLKAAAATKCTGLFVMCSKLPDLIWKDVQFDEAQSYYDRILSVDLLVLDELIFFENKSDYLVEQIVRERLNLQKSTIITTNLSISGENSIQQRYPALYNVMTEYLIPINFSKHNFRNSIAEELKREFLQ